MVSMPASLGPVLPILNNHSFGRRPASSAETRGQVRPMTSTSDAKQPHPDSSHASETVSPHIVFIAAAAALGGFLFCYDSAVINGAVTGIQHQFNVGSGTTGFIVAAALPGAAAGALLAGWMADGYARIKVMRLAAVLFAASGVGSMFAFGEGDLTVWRFLGGFAIGMAWVIAPAYIAEVSPPAFRGRLASFQ